jgi:hypothetical protein
MQSGSDFAAGGRQLTRNRVLDFLIYYSPLTVSIRVSFGPVPKRSFGVCSFMKYRAVIKKSGEWWIGWLIDLPGVNAQEKTNKKLLESLKIGAEDIQANGVSFEPETEMATIEVPDPAWA